MNIRRPLFSNQHNVDRSYSAFLSYPSGASGRLSMGADGVDMDAAT